MWMAELSERSGVPVPTIKFYLREGLLPRGEARGATRAAYDVDHVRRLRLIRALVDGAGFGLDRVREVSSSESSTSRTRSSPNPAPSTRALMSRSRRTRSTSYAARVAPRASPRGSRPSRR